MQGSWEEEKILVLSSDSESNSIDIIFSYSLKTGRSKNMHLMSVSYIIKNTSELGFRC